MFKLIVVNNLILELLLARHGSVNSVALFKEGLIPSLFSYTLLNKFMNIFHCSDNYNCELFCCILKKLDKYEILCTNKY